MQENNNTEIFPVTSVTVREVLVWLYGDILINVIFLKFDPTHENIALKNKQPIYIFFKKKHMKTENLMQPRHEEFCETASKNRKINLLTPHLPYKDAG